MLQREASRTSIDEQPQPQLRGRHSARLPARRPPSANECRAIAASTSVDLGPFIGTRWLWGRRGRGGQDASDCGGVRSRDQTDPGRVPRDGELQFVRSSSRCAGVGACMMPGVNGDIGGLPETATIRHALQPASTGPPTWPCATSVDHLVTIYHPSHVTSVVTCSCACCWTCREPLSLPHLGTGYQAGHGTGSMFIPDISSPWPHAPSCPTCQPANLPAYICTECTYMYTRVKQRSTGFIHSMPRLGVQ